MTNMIRRLIRLCSLGIIGTSPRAAERRQRTKLIKAQRKAITR